MFGMMPIGATAGGDPGTISNTGGWGGGDIGAGGGGGDVIGSGGGDSSGIDGGGGVSAGSWGGGAVVNVPASGVFGLQLGEGVYTPLDYPPTRFLNQRDTLENGVRGAGFGVKEIAVCALLLWALSKTK